MFITFEGIDYCGKSTQVRLLTQYLIDQDKEVMSIREPGGTQISEKVRDILADNKHHGMYAETEILLFSAARAQLLREKIVPALEKGIYVISDRFHDSTMAYQGYGRGIQGVVESVNKIAIGSRKPDITFLIDIDVDEMNKRKNTKDQRKADRIENSGDEFYVKVRDGYLKMARDEPERIKRIDGSKSVQDIHKEIISHIAELI